MDDKQIAEAGGLIAFGLASIWLDRMLIHGEHAVAKVWSRHLVTRVSWWRRNPDGTIEGGTITQVSDEAIGMSAEEPEEPVH